MNEKNETLTPLERHQRDADLARAVERERDAIRALGIAVEAFERARHLAREAQRYVDQDAIVQRAARARAEGRPVSVLTIDGVVLADGRQKG